MSLNSAPTDEVILLIFQRIRIFHRLYGNYLFYLCDDFYFQLQTLFLFFLLVFFSVVFVFAHFLFSVANINLFTSE
jgi:hypothetical protein